MEEIENDYKLVRDMFEYVMCSSEHMQQVIEALDRLKEKAERYQDLCD